MIRLTKIMEKIFLAILTLFFIDTICQSKFFLMPQTAIVEVRYENTNPGFPGILLY